MDKEYKREFWRCPLLFIHFSLFGSQLEAEIAVTNTQQNRLETESTIEKVHFDMLITIFVPSLCSFDLAKL